MIKLFESTAKDFSSNGICALVPTYCMDYEGINGDFQLEMAHPLDDDGRYKELENDRIIYAPTHKGYQPFRIYSVNPGLADELSINARHISYDMAQGYIENKAPTDAYAYEALQTALQDTGFTGTSDVEGKRSVRWVRKHNLSAIMGDEDNSIINRWGGEVDRDNWVFNVKQRIGADNGVSIAYGKNMTGLDVVENIEGVKTRVYPTGLQEDGQTVLSLPEKYIDSPYINNYANIRNEHLHYSDIVVGSEDYPTEEDAYNGLRAAAQQAYDNGLDKPDVSINVEFVDLSQTVEYQDYAILEKVSLGDTVRVYNKKVGVDVTSRAVYVKYNCLLERYNQISISKVMPTLAAATKHETEALIKTEIQPMQSDIDRATALLNSPGNSYVRFMPDIANPSEIYIMDNEDPDKAKKVMRLNVNGWGGSINGTGGPFLISATLDGQLNATRITTGTLNAELVAIAGGLINLSGDGIVVQNTAISAETDIDTNGLRLYTIVDGNKIIKGGLYKPNGANDVLMVASALQDPSVDVDTLIRIIKSGRGTGLNFIFKGVSGGSVLTQDGGLFLTSPTDMSVVSGDTNINMSYAIRSANTQTRAPGIYTGTTILNSLSYTRIDYSFAYFTEPPRIVASAGVEKGTVTNSYAMLKLDSTLGYSIEVDWFAYGRTQ